MLINRTKSLILIIVCFCLMSCAVSNRDTILTTEPLDQVEKLFKDEKKQIELEQDEIPKTIAVLPFNNLTESDGAFEVVRRVIYNHIASKNYHMLHWQAVDDKLSLAGIDLAQAHQMDSAKLADILEVDGVIFGDINHFERIFAGIVTQIKVGVELRFYNRNGQLLWQESDTATSRAGGISVSPIGLLLNAAVATLHLKEENLLRAADDVGRELAKVMPQPKRLATAAGPSISTVIHNGINKTLKYGDLLEVGLQGQAGMRAQVNIEGVGNFDLQEVEPGEYLGKIPVSKKANAKKVVVEGVLMDQQGNISRWLSPFGLVTVDNIAPTAPQNLNAAVNAKAVNLSWQADLTDEIATYQVYLLDTETKQKQLVKSTQETQLSISNLTNFVDYQFDVVALDQAGNQSEVSRITAKPVPDAGFNQYAVLEPNLANVIQENSILSKAQSPYYLNQTTRLNANATLLVEPGVEIIASRNANLTVLGSLKIYGESNALVTVTAADKSGFRQFLALNGQASVMIDYLKVEGADVAITIQAGEASIKNSHFINNQFSAFDISGNARPSIQNCEISGSFTAGMIISGHAIPKINNNKFINNQPFHIQSSSIYEIDASNNKWQPAADSLTVLGKVKY
ncbi:GNA1162 family protein [Catenovulum maritimum]|uniref:Fibronectin type-III domain-containing protein n=1 Tax=Catenovulum maritimum TaxID=1513271 RepID=A0A0J8GU31_9ALTE|nr:GNA1162 family protein [Catenovulum maritimum]KMT66252.1 hypothetical protein XM47_04460 [Catenovulum maritimum]